MLEKFKNLLKTPEQKQKIALKKTIDEKIFIQIKSGNFEFLHKALESGYILSGPQVQHLLWSATNSRQMTAYQLEVESHLGHYYKKSVQDSLTHMLKISTGDGHSWNFSSNMGNIHEFDIKFGNLLSKPHFMQFVHESVLETMLQICELNVLTSNSHNFAEYKKLLLKYYNEKDTELLNSIKSACSTQSTLQTLLRALPKNITEQLSAIQASIDSIDASQLSNPAEFKQLTEKSLPELLIQYASIDKNMLQYKNAQSQTIEQLLGSSLEQIKTQLEDYKQEIDRQNVKSFKIAAKHMTAHR